MLAPQSTRRRAALAVCWRHSLRFFLIVLFLLPQPVSAFRLVLSSTLPTQESQEGGSEEGSSFKGELVLAVRCGSIATMHRQQAQASRQQTARLRAARDRCLSRAQRGQSLHQGAGVRLRC